MSLEIENRAISLAENRYLHAHLWSADIVSPPETRRVEMPKNVEVPFSIYGDNEAAKTLAFVVVPYGTSVDDESQQVRLTYMQAALGPEYCIVATQIHDPKTERFSLGELRSIYKGDLSPMGDRLLKVIETVNPNDDQEIMLHSFSLGSDISVDLTYRTLTDPHRGVVHIDRLGAWECARIENRGLIRLSQALAKSGDALFENVLASGSPALWLARGLDLADPSTPEQKRKHDKSVKRDVARYTMADLKANIAGFKGFGRDTTLQQLAEIADDLNRPETVIGHLRDSLVCTDEFAQAVRQLGYKVVELAGDHSSADNVRRSGHFILITALATAAA